MSATLLRLAGVGKDYAKVETRGGRMRLVSTCCAAAARRTCSARSTTSRFELARGESLGIIGENGAGKSTLLKIIAGVIPPTRGTLVVNGRVGALLELGSGFHPEYTGLANIDLAAALLGLAPARDRGKRDEIIAFADIGEHIDDPIKHYSSGMVVRLGFAVATALAPDILITDEVLAVGDESFQKKCIAWMERYLDGGGTLLLCSHSMYHVQKLCRDALWLKDGRVGALRARRRTVTQAYLAYHEEKSRRREGSRCRGAAAAAAGVYAIQSLTLDPGDAASQGGERCRARRGLLARRPRAGRAGRHRARRRHAGVRRRHGHGRRRAERVGDDRFAFALAFAALPLLPGKYFVRAHALDPEGVRLFDNVERELVVTGTTRELGLVRLAHRWNGEPGAER